MHLYNTLVLYMRELAWARETKFLVCGSCIIVCVLWLLWLVPVLCFIVTNA